MSLYAGSLRDDRVRDYLAPVRVVASEGIASPEALVGKHCYQSYTGIREGDYQVMTAGSWLVVDFGREIAGGVRLTTGFKGGRVRIRFGESVSETMQTPNQDHSIHDVELNLPKMGTTDFGSTGFRFVRVDALEGDLQLLGLNAVAVYHDYPQVGTFRCSDERVNRVRDTAVYTVQLNMQDYIYDGVKRDRLVWLGDLNPEIRVILATFDHLELIPKSLDAVRDQTPLPAYMNSIMTYSAWWIINQRDYFLHTGDLNYLRQQRDYLLGLLQQFRPFVSDSGRLNLGDTWCFLDWPTNGNRDVQHAGGQGLFAMMFQAAETLCRALGETAAADSSRDCHRRLLTHQPDCLGNKTAAAMLTLAGIRDCSDVLTANPTAGVSTFYGYYMIKAQPVTSALRVIRDYWGAMLDFGATTFWEDFDLDWIRNSNRIDELPIPGKDDLHADFGKYCYLGLRHSLCHGWAGGPAAFLAERVLGVSVLEPGCRKVRVKPDLGDLDFAEGTYPTPLGPIAISAKKGAQPDIQAPSGITICTD